MSAGSVAAVLPGVAGAAAAGAGELAQPAAMKIAFVNNKGAATNHSAAFVEQMDFPGTRRYVEAVLRRYEYYRSRFPEPLSPP